MTMPLTAPQIMIVTRHRHRRRRIQRQRPILHLVLLSLAGLVFIPSHGHYTCNAFSTISPRSLIIGSRANQHHTAVAVTGGFGAGVSRRYSTTGGNDQSLPTDIDVDEDDSHLLQHHHQQQQQQSQQQTTRNNRRDFIVHSIATTSSVVVGSTMLSMMSPPFVNNNMAFAAEDDTPTTTSSSSTMIDPSIQMPTITQTIYLDIKFEKYVEPKRLIIGLFGRDVPKTVENFVKLCTTNNNNNYGGEENKSGASYVGSTFYRVLSENSIQGGGIGSPNNDGSRGTSAYEGGQPFLPDNYNIRHTLPGLVSAVRANSEGLIDSRFFIQTESDAGWADGRYAAFGIVLDNDEKKGGEDGNIGGSSGGGGGMDLVRRISRVDVTRPRNSPKESVTIVGCGLL